MSPDTRDTEVQTFVNGVQMQDWTVASCVDRRHHVAVPVFELRGWAECAVGVSAPIIFWFSTLKVKQQMFINRRREFLLFLYFFLPHMTLQDSSTRDLIFTVPQIISFLSMSSRLEHLGLSLHGWYN